MIIIVALVTYRATHDKWLMAASKQGDYASSMLREAVEHGDYAKVAQLIDKGVNLHTCIDSSQNSVLHLASREGHYDIVKLLLQKGADTKASNTQRETPLHVAASRGNSRLVQILHSHGADLGATNRWGDTPLHSASSAGQEATIKVLLELGADPRATNEVGRTPLHNAAYFGKSLPVLVLLNAGVDVNVKDEADNTPLHHASTNNSIKTVEILLEHGAIISTINIQGNTPLDLATDSEIRHLLSTFEPSADRESRNRSKSSPKQLPASHKHIRKFSYPGETEDPLSNSQMEKRGKLYDRIVAHGKDRELQEARQQIQQLQNEVESLTQQLNEDQPYWIVSREEIVITDQVIGRGGWGEVRVASFRKLRVAAKYLYEGIVSGYNSRLFCREMKMAAKVRHPNLLQFIGATVEGTPIILTELMPTSLRKELEHHSLTTQQVLHISYDVACALNYLHLCKPHPILHRDVSSGNVLMELTFGNIWKAKLSDYGSANFFRCTASANPGNPSYSAPEASNPQLHSPKMDCYSFGVLLIEMTLREFPGTTPMERQQQLTRITWQAILPIIRQCIDTDIANRPTMDNILTFLSQ